MISCAANLAFQGGEVPGVQHGARPRHQCCREYPRSRTGYHRRGGHAAAARERYRRAAGILSLRSSEKTLRGNPRSTGR